jgi:ATP synthase protein I
MAGSQPSKPPQRSGANDGWSMVGYLLSGIAVWGGIGWLVDRWLHWGGIPIAVGVIVGAGLGIYLMLKRFGT